MTHLALRFCVTSWYGLLELRFEVCLLNKPKRTDRPFPLLHALFDTIVQQFGPDLVDQAAHLMTKIIDKIHIVRINAEKVQFYIFPQNWQSCFKSGKAMWSYAIGAIRSYVKDDEPNIPYLTGPCRRTKFVTFYLYQE